MGEKQVEVCPSCGNKMEEGYIAAADLVAWSEKKISNWSLKPIPSNAMIAHRPIRGIVNLEAYRCPKCKLILIRYGQTRDRDGTPRSFMKKCTNCDREIPIASETCPYCSTKQH